MNERLMRTLAKMDSTNLSKNLTHYLRECGYHAIRTKDYILAEGSLPICLIAHMDTVGTAPPEDIYYDKEAHIMWSPQLLGADDRAGIYAIIQIIQSGYRPSVIFTEGEEKGAIGAATLVTQYPICPLENLKAIFQLDRQGYNDCVFYDCDNPDFTNFVEKFGFKTNIGSFSDISVIAPTWGVAAVNLSVGYENEHSFIETLNTQFLERTILKVKEICEQSEKMLSYTYIEKEYPKINDRECIFCNKKLKNNEGYTFENDGFIIDICRDCYKKYYFQ